jgi:hypothetical protein
MNGKSPWLGAALVLPALALSALSHAADMGKTLRLTFQVAETGFDPTRTSDYYSGMVIEAIYDRLLTYDYLARPSKLVPLAAESLPHITDNGKTYTFKIKKGIYFTPDPAFKGKKRSLRRRTMPTRSSVSSIPGTGRRTRSCSRERSSGSMSSAPGPRKRAGSTTMRRSRDSKSRTGIPCEFI